MTKSKAQFGGTIPLALSVSLVLFVGFLFSNLVHAYASSKDLGANLDKNPNTSDQQKIGKITLQNLAKQLY